MTKKLISTQDVINALQEEQKNSNEQRMKLGLIRIRSIFLGNNSKIKCRSTATN